MFVNVIDGVNLRRAVSDDNPVGIFPAVNELLANNRNSALQSNTCMRRDTMYNVDASAHAHLA